MTPSEKAKLNVQISKSLPAEIKNMLFLTARIYDLPIREVNYMALVYAATSPEFKTFVGKCVPYYQEEKSRSN